MNVHTQTHFRSIPIFSTTYYRVYQHQKTKITVDSIHSLVKLLNSVMVMSLIRST